MSRTSPWFLSERFLLLILLPGIILFLGSPGVLQAGESRVRLEMVVPVVQHLEAEPAVLSAPAVTPSDLARGYLDLDRPITLTVYSNTPWEITIRRSEEPPGGSDPVLPPLLWSRGSLPFANLTDQWIPVASGSKGTAGTRIELRLRVPLGWTGIGPGTYEPRIEYKLAPSGF